MPSVRSAALGFFVGTGSRGESPGEAGLSHFLEHLLFRGTDRYASAEIDQLFDGMGAELNAGTDKESTTVYARMLDQHLPRAFDVIADMVWRPAFRDVDPEREVVLEEIAMYEDDPQDTVFDVLGQAVFGGHPLGRPIIGRAPVIRDTPVETIAAFHAARYVPGSVVIAAAGSVDHDQIVELAERTLGGQRGRHGAADRARAGRPRSDRAVPAQGHRAGARVPRRRRSPARRRAAVRLARARRDLRRPVVLAAVPGRARGARARVLGLLVRRPVRRHRPDRPLRRHAAGQGRATRWPSWGRSSRACASTPATEEELVRARENVKARVVLALESTGARMNRLGASLLFGLPLLETDEVIARFEAVTLDDLRELTDELWVPERLSAAGIGPDEQVFRSAVAGVCPGAVVAA